MKKLTILSVLFAFCTASIHGQGLDIQLGKTISGMSNFDDATTESWDEWFVNQGYLERVQEINNDMMLGFVIGVSKSFPIGSSLVFNPALQIAQHGGKAYGSYGIPNGNDVTNFSSAYRITQIQIPLSLQYWFGNFFVELDPQLAVMLFGNYIEQKKKTKPSIPRQMI